MFSVYVLFSFTQSHRHKHLIKCITCDYHRFRSCLVSVSRFMYLICSLRWLEAIHIAMSLTHWIVIHVATSGHTGRNLLWIFFLLIFFLLFCFSCFLFFSIVLQFPEAHRSQWLIQEICNRTRWTHTHFHSEYCVISENFSLHFRYYLVTITVKE